MSETVRPYILRGVQFFMGLDGVLHLAEVASAYNEEAYFTLALTTLHACVFFAAAYFIGHDQTHHRERVELL
jgi:hypothetical protein